MDSFFFIIQYISYLLKSGNEHSIHSPFVFDLYTNAIKPRKQFYVFPKIEAIRTSLLNSTESILVTDLGAGSKIDNSKRKNVRDIAKNSLKPADLGQLLFRVTEYLKPNVIFDLGTSLGVTTLYFAEANRKAKVYTFEGCFNTIQIAEKNFERLHASNIKIVSGNLDETLRSITETKLIPDLVFFDANHRYDATMKYFTLLLENAGEETCFIFDDIHWSAEMTKAWKEISQHPKVTVSIDLFYMGLVFFRSKQKKEHFILRS